MHNPGNALRWLSLLILCLFGAFALNGSAQQMYYLYGGGSYSPGEEVTLSAHLAGGNTGSITLYSVGNPWAVLDYGGPGSFAGTSELQLTELRTLEVNKTSDMYSAEVNLGALPLGLYFVQLGKGDQAAATLLLVTDLALVVKSDSGSLLAYTADLQTGEAREAEVWLLSGNSISAESHSEQGITFFQADLTGEQNHNAAARSGDSWAFSGVWWNSWAVEQAKVYVVTDRPVYRPGQTVDFKGTIRAAGTLAPLSDQPVEVVITDPDSTEVLRGSFTTDSYGSFNGSVLLSAAAQLGYYSIELTYAGQQYWGSFEVLEYRKPEYEVNVSSAQDVLIQGGTAEFEIDAEYLFGGPVAGGSVTWAVLRQPYYRYSYRSAFEFYNEAPYFGGDMIERGEGRLGADGKLLVSVALPVNTFDYQLTLQAGVSDESNHEVSSSATITAYRADLVLGVDSNRYAYRDGEEATISVQADDLSGSPISTSFTISTERYYWVEGAGRQVEPGVTLSGVTDASGAGSVTVSFPQQGSWGITVTATDSEGRQTSSDTTVWVSGSGRWYWNYQDISVQADQDEYQVGDTARFVIQSPVPDAVALITREGQKLGDYELVRFEGSVLSFELTITEADLPNSFIGVVIVGNGQIYSATGEYRVPPADRFLNVEITSDSDTYQPGTSGQFTLRVSDATGKGVPAQLTLGLVDEAIYLIRPDSGTDIRGFFYALRSNAVGTELSSFAYFGSAQPLAGREALGSAVFAQSKAEAEQLADARLREDFRDTILWLPSLVTNPDGTATVTVDFPDNLTRWRLTARAITLGNEVGQSTYGVTTTLPVIARLVTPQFLVAGDTTQLRVIGQSNLDTDQQAELNVTASGLDMHDAGIVTRELPAAGRVTADYQATATQPGTASVTGEVLTSVFSDAMRLPLPVIPHGIHREQTHSASGSDTWTLQIPAGTDPTTLTGMLYLTPSLASAVTPALAWLAGYPYGCTEQTMSRFLPSVLAARAGHLARLPQDVATDLDTFVQLGLQNIYDFQHGDGGWGFWQFDISNPFITAYVTNGLLEAQSAGYEVRQWVLDNALDYLEGASIKDTYQVHSGIDIAERRTADADAKAYAYFALARAGRNIDALSAVAGGREMSNYGLALSVLAFNVAGRQIEARFHLDQLTARVSEHASVAYWDVSAPRYTWSDDQVEATAFALEALALLQPDSPLIPKIVNWLLLERQGARWTSTKDTAAVVTAALTLEQTRPQQATAQSVSVRLNGTELRTVNISADADSIGISLEGLQAGSNTVEVVTATDSTLHSSASVSYVAVEEFDQPASSGITVQRTYELLTARFDTVQQRILYDRSSATSAAVGDYLLVSVTLQPEADLRFVLVNEPLPAGYSVIEDDYAFRVAGITPRYGYDYYGWNYWYDGRQIHDQHIDYYFSRISKPVTFTYVLRAETPGEFTALPTHAWMMYAPDMEGISAREILQVTPDDSGQSR